MSELNAESISQIEDRIDKRITQSYDVIELRVRKEVDGIITSRFDRITKIFGYSIAALSIVITALGVKTVFDLREVAQNAAIDEVKKKLLVDDPNSNLRTEIDKTIARGLIDSYLISLSKKRNERFAPSISISESDSSRLRKLISDLRTSEKDFSDAIQIILSANRSPNYPEDKKLIDALVQGRDEKLKWILDQPEKRAAILSSLHDQSALKVAKEIISNPNAEKRLLTRAIKYAGLYDAEVPRNLAEYILNSDEEISHAALIAVARLDPRSSALEKRIGELKKSASLDDLGELYFISSSIMQQKARSIMSEDKNINVRLEKAADGMQYIIDADAVFTISSSFNDETDSISLQKRANQSSGLGVGDDLVTGPLNSALNVMLKRSAADNLSFSKDIRALCLEELFRSGGRCWGVVRGTFEGGGLVNVLGTSLDANTAPGGFALRASTSAPDAKIIVDWTDVDGQSKTGIFLNINGADKIHFSLVSSRGRKLGESSEN